MGNNGSYEVKIKYEFIEDFKRQWKSNIDEVLSKDCLYGTIVMNIPDEQLEKIKIDERIITITLRNPFIAF